MTPGDMILVADRSSSMKEVLTSLGYDIWKIPLQIPCPVHKLGQESRPSARIYEDDKAVYCFYCVVQYRATEVWAAMKGVDRSTAADEILKKWPVSDEDSQDILRKVRIIPPPRVVEVYQGVLERHLVSYKRLANFRSYRKWAKACDDFMDFIGTISRESQEIAIRSFIERMGSDILRGDGSKLNLQVNDRRLKGDGLLKGWSDVSVD